MSNRSHLGNASWVLLATVLAGGVAYVVQLLAPGLLRNDEKYIAFSVLWSAIYLGVSALSGVQQEFSRATHARRTDATGRGSSRVILVVFAVLGLGAAAAALVIAFIVAPRSVAVSPLTLLPPIVLALVGYLALAMLSGMLAGLHRWPTIAAVTIFDAVLRAAVLIMGFTAGWNILALTYAIAAPFGLAALGGLLLLRAELRKTVRFDAGPKELITNALTTVGGAVAMGAVISGLPLVIGVTMPHAPAAWLAGALFAIMLTRAPIVTPAIALQSFIVATFRGPGEATPQTVSRGAVMKGIFAIVGVAALAIIAALIGPALVRWLSGGSEVDSQLMFVIVLSAFLAAALSSTAALLIARSRHALSALGWAATAVLTVLCLLIPIAPEPRLILALLVPPAVGLGIHVTGLLRRSAPEPR